MSLRKERKLQRYLDYTEFEKMVEAARNDRDKILLKCLFYFGLRNSELCNLKKENIDFVKKMVYVTGKGKKQREIVIPDIFFDEFSDWTRNKEGFLFSKSNDRHLSDRHIRRIIKGISSRGNIRKSEEIHPHTVRHSYASLLYQEGVPLPTIQKMLGHASVQTTSDIYTHFTTESQRDVINEAFKRAKEKNKAVE